MPKYYQMTSDHVDAAVQALGELPTCYEHPELGLVSVDPQGHYACWDEETVCYAAGLVQQSQGRGITPNDPRYWENYEDSNEELGNLDTQDASMLQDDEGDLPGVAGKVIQPKISAEDVGEDSDDYDPGLNMVDSPEEELEEDSDMFEDPRQAVLYQRVRQLEAQNERLAYEQRAAELGQRLLDYQAAGYPIGSVEKVCDYLLGQDDDQVVEYFELLEEQPRVQMSRITEDYSLDRIEDEVAQDYQENQDTYRALGVTRDGLGWGRFCRTAGN